MDSLQNVYPDAPLNPGSQEMRIFELLPGLRGSKIHGRLIRHDLQRTGVTLLFEALSYRWGLTQNAKTIQLNNNLDFKITAALESALQVLRSVEEARLIWIDAICINQGDVQERNHQVQLMRKIYSHAKTVRIWLDVDIDDNCAAMVKLRSFDSLSDQKDLGQDPSFWEPLCAVSKDAYWMRVWIQQEISNARSLAIQCRRVLIPVPKWYHYVRLTYERTEALDFNTPVWLDWLDIRPNLQLPKRFGFWNSAVHPVKGSTLSEDNLNLLSILSSSFKFKCTDDRDRLYGLLHLAQDYSEEDIEINYEYSVSEVYTSVARFLLLKYKSLEFLLFAGINWRDPSKEREVPTWVPDWRAPSTRSWLSHSPKQRQEASQLEVKFQSAITGNGSSLQTYGLRIDRIEYMFCFPEGVDLYNSSAMTFLQTCGNMIQKSISVRADAESGASVHENIFNLPQWHALARVLSGVDFLKREDSGANNTLRAIVTSSADKLVKAIQSSGATVETDLVRMIDIIRPNNSNDPHPGGVFVQFLWGVIGKHQPFVGRNGGIGMALSSAQPGDEVWIIPGCDQPMILRSNRGHYLVVGEGSYDGANRGELLRDIPDDVEIGDVINSYKFESITLC